MLQWVYRYLRKNRRGFAMLDILLGVLILGIFAVGAMPHFTSIREDAQRTQAKEDVKSVIQQVQVYAAQTGNYPTTGLASLTTSMTTTVTMGGTAKGPWMSRVPQTDPWNNAYVWTFNAGTIAEFRSTGNGTPIAVDLITGATVGF